MSRVKNILFDVRFWILLLFLIRLENINLPPYDEHSWRQTITLGVARNYLEWDANFFHPRTVVCDSRGGIQAQEFPLLNYLIFLIWKVLGPSDWTARLLSLLVASIGLFYFEKIARRFVDPRAALAATVIFGVSIAFTYSRKAMPDVFAVSLCLIGVHYGWKFWENRNKVCLVWFGLYTTLAILAKMPAICVLGLLTWPLIRYKSAFKDKGIFILAASLALVAPLLWYYVWVPWAERTYNFWLMYPSSFKEGFEQLTTTYRHDLRTRFYPIALTSTIAFVAFVAGLTLTLWYREKGLIWSFLGYTGLLILYMLKAGGTFAGHKYYVIPYVPMMALLAGYGLHRLLKNDWLLLLVVALIATEAIYIHKADFFIHPGDRKYRRLEAIADQYIPKDSRILVNNRGTSPVMLYAAHRIGWSVDDRMKDAEWVRGESTVGLDYMIIERSRWNEPLPFPLLYEDEDFRVYRVKK
jgi:4-amino-4-deoxy-L-arabinose transferase-like glycosyltransferase